MSDSAPLHPAADRNLLFGVLALQADLIDSERFARACTLWSAQKTTPLADLLVQQGWLTPADRADVERLLERKLRKHGGNARAGLAEVTTDHLRQSLAGLTDPDIRQSLAGPTPPPLGHVLIATTDYVPETRDRYTLSRLHATGGIGRVWLARDAALGRDVALKELRPERAGNPSIWARFLREAQVTGQLEHPGVVPVYEVGRRPDDQAPFYTMRFVRGHTLAEAVAAYYARRARGEVGPLELREFLNAFVGVCNAVAYAHSRGVLHRDLKPQNVVLGDYGEVVVLDWGLARLMDEPEGDAAPLDVTDGGAVGATVQGQVLGTPAYLSPEQAEGRQDLLGPCTDVYGLGAVLYEILVGSPPFSGPDTTEVLRRVRHREPDRPRSLVPGTPPALEAICLKALAKKPADRYGTAKELAGEVQRWLADEPVSALPDSWGARVARWSRRHRSTTRAVAASLVVIATVATLAALAIGREQAQTRDALAAEKLARLDERKARELAQEQSQLALDAIREYNTGVTREFLLRQPEMENLRKSLLQAPIRFYRRLAQNIENNGITDPSARARLGQAQIDLGEIINETGTIEDSIINFEQARDNMEQVVRDVPGVPEYRFLLARTRCFLANRYDKASRPDEARKAFEKALSDFEQLAQANPEDRKYRAKQAEALQLYADFLWDHGDLNGSRRDYLASVAIGAALIREYPDDLELLDKHASALNNLSLLFGDAGEKEKRMRMLVESTALRERLVAATPADDQHREDYLSNLGSCYGNLGTSHMENGALDEAASWTRKALVIQDEQIKKRPNSVDYLERVGANHVVLGQLELRTGHLATARTELEQGRAYLERLLHVRPGDVIFRMHLVTCLGLLADVEIESGANTLALNLARRGVSEAEETLRINPNYHPAAHGLASQLLRDAETSWDIGQSDRALANLDRAEAILRRLVASHPELPNYRSDLATTIRVHAQMDSEIGRGHDAEPRMREALALSDSALPDDPNTAALYSDLATTLSRRGQPAEARTLFVRALDRLDQAKARSPRDAHVRHMLARTLAARAEFLRRLGQLRESLDDWDRALAVAADTDLIAFRLGRAATLSRTSDYRAALAEATAADRSIDDRGNQRMNSALAHALLSSAIRRDRSLTQDARAEGAAIQLAAALQQICQARRSPAYRDTRRFYHRLGDLCSTWLATNKG